MYSDLLKSTMNEDKKTKDTNYEISSEINENNITLNIEFTPNTRENNVILWDDELNDNVSFNGNPFDKNEDNTLYDFLNNIDLLNKILKETYNEVEKQINIDDKLKIFIEKENENIKYNIKYIESIKN